MSFRIEREHSIPSQSITTVQNNNFTDKIEVFPISNTPTPQPLGDDTDINPNTSKTDNKTENPEEKSQRQQQQINEVLHMKEQSQINELEATAQMQLDSKNTIINYEAIETTKQIAEIENNRLKFERLTPLQQSMVLIIKSKLAGEDIDEETYATLKNNEKDALNEALEYLNQVPKQLRDDITEDLIAFAVKKSTGDYERDYIYDSVRDIVMGKVRLHATGDNYLLDSTLKEDSRAKKRLKSIQTRPRSEDLRRRSIELTGYDPVTKKHVKRPKQK